MRTEVDPQELGTPEDGWLPLNMPRNFGKGRSFVSGEPEGDRLRIHYFQRESDQVLCAKVWFGMGAEGPPGHAHGGSMAAVLDEAMGFAAWVAGHPVVAATITINFQKKLPLETVLFVETWVDRVDDRKVYTRGKIFHPGKDRIFADAEGLFIKQPIEHFGALGRTAKMREAQAEQEGCSDT
ncbi:MAG: PaaI family thioesterase [Candidatus Hydrogenedentes bacterium]|nr:PaaI family thioesterase [Candidatus Hydrogenedentota bacterium]